MSFGLGVIRHRGFETSWMVWAPPRCIPSHPGFVASVFGHGAKRGPRHTGQFVDHATASTAMGVDWMNQRELSQAVPPAYTEWLGDQLLDVVRARVTPCDGGAP
jgi:DNA (cytosine-5)-methyltransferase 1